MKIKKLFYSIGSKLHPGFNEKQYLDINEDVKFAVINGQFVSGYQHFIHCGKSEGRMFSGAHESNRRAFAKSHLNLSGLGLEIGPSHNPIMPKRDGYKVEIVDHLSADDLKLKYREHGVNVERIEEVDYVSSGEKLSQLIGKKNHYDWIIASHVVEHLPDLVTFLRECEALLNEKGKLFLVIPDKHQCFDICAPLSTTGLLLDAYIQERRRPTSGQIFDESAHAVFSNGNLTWGNNKKKLNLSKIHDLAFAKNRYKDSIEREDYVDVHCWRFMPESFELIIKELQSLELLGMIVAECTKTFGSEFFVVLSKGGYQVDDTGHFDLLKKAAKVD